MSLTISRCAMPCRNGVTAPTSIAIAPTAIMWLLMRFSSATSTRMHSARSGTCDAVGVRDEHRPLDALADLLDRAVQVAVVRRAGRHHFAVALDDDAQHAVGR